MKGILKPLILAASVLAGALFTVGYSSSCNPDKCKAISCAYGGTCAEGACKCQPGYEGNQCETITRKKYVGFWAVKEQGSVTPARQYPLSIENDTAVTGVLIKNLYNYFSTEKIHAYVQGDSLIIPNQQLMGKVVFGKGYITSVKNGTNNAIVMRYEVIDVATQRVDDFGFYSDIDMSQPSQWEKQ